MPLSSVYALKSSFLILREIPFEVNTIGCILNDFLHHLRSCNKERAKETR